MGFLVLVSRDQHYLYNICNVVRGHPRGNTDYARDNKPGPVNHSRWLTTGCRILRLYISTDRNDPDYGDLRTLAEFVIRSYAQVWFEVKCNPFIADQAKHFFKMVKTTRYLPVVLRKVVDKELRINFTAGHCENLLLTMLGDPSKKVQAIATIKHIRRIRPTDRERATETSLKEMQKRIRKFRTPKFRFDLITSSTSDDQYDLLLDLSQVEELTEPPLTMEIPENELINFEVPKFPCHTQQTERIIRIVSETSQRVIGQESRHGYIVNTMYSRSVTGRFESKQDYNPHDVEELLAAKRRYQASKK